MWKVKLLINIGFRSIWLQRLCWPNSALHGLQPTWSAICNKGRFALFSTLSTALCRWICCSSISSLNFRFIFSELVENVQLSSGVLWLTVPSSAQCRSINRLKSHANNSDRRTWNKLKLALFCSTDYTGLMATDTAVRSWHNVAANNAEYKRLSTFTCLLAKSKRMHTFDKHIFNEIFCSVTSDCPILWTFHDVMLPNSRENPNVMTLNVTRASLLYHMADHQPCILRLLVSQRPEISGLPVMRWRNHFLFKCIIAKWKLHEKSCSGSSAFATSNITPLSSHGCGCFGVMFFLPSTLMRKADSSTMNN